MVLPAAANWPGLPAATLEKMRRAAIGGARKSLGQLSDLITLSQTLETAGLPYLVLKGQPLSVLLYGEPHRRQCGDIDLLVSPGDFTAAARLLFLLGYRPIDGMPPIPDDGDGHLPAIRDLIMVRDGIIVELHQRLTSNPHRLPWTFDRLYGGRQMVAMAGRQIPTLGPGHLALYLFVHGASHGWERLAWLCDFATLCRDESEKIRLIHQAREMGMAPALGQAFALIRELFGISPPPGLRVPARPGRLTRWLAAGPAKDREGPAWLWRNLCWHWVCWRLRQGPVAFWRELAYDLKAPVGTLRSPFYKPFAAFLRPFGFLWRHLRPRQ